MHAEVRTRCVNNFSRACVDALPKHTQQTGKLEGIPTVVCPRSALPSPSGFDNWEFSLIVTMFNRPLLAHFYAKSMHIRPRYRARKSDAFCCGVSIFASRHRFFLRGDTPIFHLSAHPEFSRYGPEINYNF